MRASTDSQEVAAFNVESEPPRASWLLASVIFPFLLLTEDGWRRPLVEQHRYFVKMIRWCQGLRPRLPRNPKMGHFFMFVLLLMMLINAGVVYLFLSISSMTHHMHKGKDGQISNVLLKPRVGHHWTYATIGKYVLQIFIINYLCWRVLEANPQVMKMRLQDPGGLNKPGLIHGIRKMLSYVFCYPFKEMWLSTHFIDHVLLSVTGFPYSLLQPMISWMHIELRGKGIELVGAHQGDFLIITSGILACYSGVLLVGFLCVTMGYGMRVRPGYSNAFQLSTLALAVLMALEFLVQQQARQRYLQFHLKEDGLQERSYATMRASMAFSQLFSTHSLCMLCAIHLGHAKHFHKCPDLPWRVVCKEVLGLLLFIFAVSCLGYSERLGHLWPICDHLKFMAGAFWECLVLVLHILSGLLLLVVGLHHSTEKINVGTLQDWKMIVALMSLFDLDSFLIFVTYVAATLYLLVEVYDLMAERLYDLWSFQILESSYNLGLAVFTFAVWKQPPRRSLPRRCLWLALALVFESFLHHQLLEDCEFASSMPGCCAFPSVNNIYAEGGHRLWHMCALDARCAVEHPASHSDNRSYFCKLPLDFHHQESHEPASQYLWALSEAEFSAFQPASHCDLLKERWKAFPDELKIEEHSEHEEAFSPIFKQFKVIGTAGRIEFYFALMGILMKVILFVEHPNSDLILEMKGESHGGH